MHLENEKKMITSSPENRDLQGEGGGGGGGNLTANAYTNPTLTASNGSVFIEKCDYKGSDAFIVSQDDKKHVTTFGTDRLWPWMCRKVQGACSRKMLRRRFPPFDWLPQYDGSAAVGDLLAGITVGLTVIPQALAYSNIAGLPPQYGLYGSFLGCFVYIILGSCKDVPMGPTAIAALLTCQVIDGRGPEHAILLCFFTGLIQLLMGLFGLGFLIDFVSGPVSSGFTSAVALIIITSQIKDVLGIRASGTTFVSTWKSIFDDIHNTNASDAIFGLVCIVVLLLMRLLAKTRLNGAGAPSRLLDTLNGTLWLIGTARNAILVIVSAFIGYAYSTSPPFQLIGYVPEGLPEFKAPPFLGYDAIVGNQTTMHVGLIEMVSNLGSGIIVVPLIGLLEDIAICKAFANGKAVDATQELIAIGVSNLANSFCQSFPGTGSLSRSAVNNSSGVRTTFGAFYTGLLVIIALLFFTPHFYYIPKASLAAIIIAAVIFMVEVKVVKPMWRTKKSDLIPGLAAFIACLVLPLELGILLGIGVNLLFILYHAARPKISIEKLISREGVEYLMLTPDRCLIFPSVDYVRNLVTKYSIRQGIPVVIDCTHIYGADYTAATVIETLLQDFAARDQPLFFFNLKPSVGAVFEGLSPQGLIAYYNQEDIDVLLKHKDCIKRRMMNV